MDEKMCSCEGSSTFFEEIAEDIAFVLGQEAAHGRMIDGKDLEDV
jgi:hypothetical protein